MMYKLCRQPLAMNVYLARFKFTQETALIKYKHNVLPLLTRSPSLPNVVVKPLKHPLIRWLRQKMGEIKFVLRTLYFCQWFLAT